MLKKQYILVFFAFLINYNLFTQIILLKPKQNSTVISPNPIKIEWYNKSLNPISIFFYDNNLKDWLLIQSNIKENSFTWYPPSFLYGEIKIKLESPSFSKPNLIYEFKNAHSIEVREAIFSPNSQFTASVGADKWINIWNIDKKIKEDSVKLDNANNIRSLKFFDDENAVFFVADNSIYIWDRVNRIVDLIYTDDDIDTDFYFIDYLPVKSLIAVADKKKNKFLIYNLFEKTTKIFSENGFEVNTCKFNPNSENVAYIQSNSFIAYANILDLNSDNIIYKSGNHGDGKSNGVIWSVDFINDTRFATAGVDNRIKIWEFNQANPIHTFDGHFGNIRSIKYSKKINTILSGSLDNTVRQWDLSNNLPLPTVTVEQKGGVLSVDYSMTGDTLLSTGRDGSIKVWKNFEKSIDTLIFDINIKSEALLYINKDNKFAVGDIDDIDLLLKVDNAQIENEKYKAEVKIEIPTLLTEPIEKNNVISPKDTLIFNYENYYKNGIVLSIPIMALQSYYNIDSVKIIDFKIIDNDLIDAKIENGLVEIINECLLSKPRNIIIDSENYILKINPTPIKDKATINVNYFESADYELLLQDLNGTTIDIINKEQVISGNREINYDFTKYNSGQYFITLNWKNKSISKKIILIQ